MESFNLKTHKKVGYSLSCLIKLAGSPVNDFNLSEIEEMAKYLGYVPDRQSGTHKTWTNPSNGKSLTYKNVKGQNPGHSFYAALKENGFSRNQIEYYCKNRKELQREKRAFLRENPNSPYTPRLSPSQEPVASPIEPVKEKQIDWDNPAYREMWEHIKSEVGQWIDDANFDQEILEWLSGHYGVPKEELQKRLVLTAKRNWYEKATIIRETGSPF